jgi:hypothetical protein
MVVGRHVSTAGRKRCSAPGCRRLAVTDGRCSSHPNEAKVGRPSKLTPDVQAIIVEATSRGCFAHIAAQAAGISASTFHLWMHEGENEAARVAQGFEPDPALAPYMEFSEQVNRARGIARGFAEARLYQEDAFKWLRYGPGRHKPGNEGWADTSKVEHSGPDGAPLHGHGPDLSQLSDDELLELHRLTTKATPKEDA